MWLFLRQTVFSLKSTLTGKWKQVLFSLELKQAGYVTDKNCSWSLWFFKTSLSLDSNKTYQIYIMWHLSHIKINKNKSHLKCISHQQNLLLQCLTLIMAPCLPPLLALSCTQVKGQEKVISFFIPQIASHAHTQSQGLVKKRCCVLHF